jgi:ribose 5-phosphate isomerase B
MRYAVASDHAGYPLKATTLAALRELGHEPLDLGVDGPEPSDYPDAARSVAEALRCARADRGILLCGSGVGASVAASKFPGVRAAVCHDTYSARQGVEHDDLNVLCIGTRVVGPELAMELVRAFAGAAFAGKERFMRRLAKVEAIEREFASAGVDGVDGVERIEQ